MPAPRLNRRSLLVLAGGGLLVGAASASASVFASRRQTDQTLRLGELTLLVRSDPWQLSLLDPAGAPLWSEAADQPLGFRARASGTSHRATHVESFSASGDAGPFRLVAATDDPAGTRLILDVRSLG